MAALAVVEDFDEVEDLEFGVSVAGEPAAVDQFQFEGTPEAFHCGVVVAVAPAAHGGDQAGRFQGRPEVPGGVLDAAVGVEEQTWRGLAVQDRHGEGGQDECRVDGRAHGPTDDPAAVEVEDAGEIEPAFVGLYVGDVGDPDLVGGSGGRRLGEAVGSDGVVVVAVGGPDAVAALLAATEAPAFHEAGHSVASMSATQVPEFEGDPGRAIGLAACGMDDRDLLRQGLVLAGTEPGILAAAIPVVEPAGRDLEEVAKHRDGMMGSHRVYPFEALDGAISGTGSWVRLMGYFGIAPLRSLSSVLSVQR